MDREINAEEEDATKEESPVEAFVEGLDEKEFAELCKLVDARRKDNAEYSTDDFAKED